MATDINKVIAHELAKALFPDSNPQKYSVTYDASIDGIRNRHDERFPEHEIDLAGEEEYLAKKAVHGIHRKR